MQDFSSRGGKNVGTQTPGQLITHYLQQLQQRFFNTCSMWGFPGVKCLVSANLAADSLYTQHHRGWHVIKNYSLVKKMLWSLYYLWFLYFPNFAGSPVSFVSSQRLSGCCWWSLQLNHENQVCTSSRHLLPQPSQTPRSTKCPCSHRQVPPLLLREAASQPQYHLRVPPPPTIAGQSTENEIDWTGDGSAEDERVQESIRCPASQGGAAILHEWT